MFLLGRSNLQNEFREIALMTAQPVIPGARVLRMFPKRQGDLKEISMEVDPSNFQIRRLMLVYNDGSRSDFRFSNIRTNTGLQASLFGFKVPDGVKIQEGIGQ
jgi:outer membrane lipoprotein-sorting protein